MIDELLRLPLHARSRLATALSAGQLAAPYSAASLQSVLGTADGNANVDAALRSLDDAGISPSGIALILEAANRGAGENKAPDFVWSGPEVLGLHARDTRAVYEEVIGTAERSLWASTYAYFDGKKAFDVLAKRMDEVTGLEVALLLNIQRKWGEYGGARNPRPKICRPPLGKRLAGGPKTRCL